MELFCYGGKEEVFGEMRSGMGNAAYCRYLKSLSTVIIGICLRVKDVLHWGNKLITLLEEWME